jgi:hypothetical protein
MDMWTVEEITRKMEKRYLQIRLAFVELGRIITNFLEERVCRTLDTENIMLLKYTTMNLSQTL